MITYFLIYAIAAGLIVYAALGKEIQKEESMKRFSLLHIFIGCMVIGWIGLPASIFRRILR